MQDKQNLTLCRRGQLRRQAIGHRDPCRGGCARREEEARARGASGRRRPSRDSPSPMVRWTARSISLAVKFLYLSSLLLLFLSPVLLCATSHSWNRNVAEQGGPRGNQTESLAGSRLHDRNKAATVSWGGGLRGGGCRTTWQAHLHMNQATYGTGWEIGVAVKGVSFMCVALSAWVEHTFFGLLSTNEANKYMYSSYMFPPLEMLLLLLPTTT